MRKIKLLLLDISDAERLLSEPMFLEKIKSPIEKGQLERIERASNEKARREKLLAYSLLYKAVAEHLPTDATPPAITYSPEGRPYFEGLSLSFSISHTEGLIVCAVCTDAGECNEIRFGVDAELLCERSELVASRATERFLKGKKLPPLKFSHLLEGCGHSKTDLSFFKLTGHGIEQMDNSFPSFDGGLESCAVGEWTRLEALLKMSGEGFCGIGSLDALLQDVAIYSQGFELEGRRYLISLALHER